MKMAIDMSDSPPTYHAVKSTPLIPLRPPLRILGLARTELAKVLCRLGHHIGEQLHLNAPKGFACGNGS
jgi:hypothetical protein